MDVEHAENERRLESIRRELAQRQESIRQHESLGASCANAWKRPKMKPAAPQQALLELTRQRDRARQVIERTPSRNSKRNARAMPPTPPAPAGAGSNPGRNWKNPSSGWRRRKANLRPPKPGADASQKLAGHEKLIAAAKQAVTRLLSESMELENRLAQIQNELHKLEKRRPQHRQPPRTLSPPGGKP